MESEVYSLDDKIIDLEWCAQYNHKPPKGRKYRIRIDRKRYVVNEECLTGRQILELAGLAPPECFLLRQRQHSGTKVSIGLDEKVDFTKPGVERFMSMPLEVKDGESLRRDFSLLPEDIQYLHSLKLTWEAVQTGNMRWLIILKFPLPEGFNVSEADLALRIEAGYPTGKLDMAYFCPALVLASGQLVATVTTIAIDGRNFQRWSRHYNWRPQIDCLETHIERVPLWLEREIKKHQNNAVSV